MKRKLSAFLACIMAVSGLGSMSANAEDIEEKLMNIGSINELFEI